MFSHRRRRTNKRKKNFLSRGVLFRLSLLLSVFSWYWYYSSHHHREKRGNRVTVNTFKTTTSLRESRQHLNNKENEENTEKEKNFFEEEKKQRQLLYPGEAREVCASWSPSTEQPKNDHEEKLLDERTRHINRERTEEKEFMSREKAVLEIVFRRVGRGSCRMWKGLGT
jgi:hypothetical protein